MAEHGQDRKLSTSLPAFVAGSLIIYGFGATWLAIDLGIPLTADAGEPSAIAFGVAPFIVGDIIKALLAGAILPAAWILAEDRR
jgi:biotin transport system substrate-specific component